MDLLAVFFSVLNLSNSPRWACRGVALVIKSLPASAGDIRDAGSILTSGRSCREGHGNPGKSHGQRSPAGYSP